MRVFSACVLSRARKKKVKPKKNFHFRKGIFGKKIIRTMGNAFTKPPWSRDQPTASINEGKKEEEALGELRMQMESEETELPVTDCFTLNDEIFMYPGSELHMFVKKIADYAEMVEDIIDAYPEIPVQSKDVLKQLNFRHVKERKIDQGVYDDSDNNDDDDEEDDEDDEEGYLFEDGNGRGSSDEEEWQPKVDHENTVGGGGGRKNADTLQKNGAIKNSVIENESPFARTEPNTSSPVQLLRPELLDLFRINKGHIGIQQLVLDKIQEMENTRQLEEKVRQDKNRHILLQQPKDIDLFGELVAWVKRNQTNFTRYATMQNQFMVCTQAFLSEQLFFIKRNKELYNKLFLEKLETPEPPPQPQSPPINFFQQKLQATQPSILNPENGSHFDQNSANTLHDVVVDEPKTTESAFDYNPMEVELWKRKFVQTEGWAFNYIQALLKMRKDMSDLYDTILEKDVALKDKPSLQSTLNRMTEDDF